MNRTIIKDTSILTPQGFQRGNLIIEDGKILEVDSLTFTLTERYRWILTMQRQKMY